MKPPKSGTKTEQIFRALQRGESLTVGDALRKYNCYALSQRIGDLKRLGWDIEARLTKMPSGATVCVYTMKGNQ